MNRTQRIEEQEVIAALERERHEPTHEIGQVALSTEVEQPLE